MVIVVRSQKPVVISQAYPCHSSLLRVTLSTSGSAKPVVRSMLLRFALYTPYTLPDIVDVNYCGAKLQDKAARRTGDTE